MEFREVLYADADQRLDRWFKRQFPSVNQIAIEKFCRKGEIRVDSCRVKPSLRLRKGQIVRIPPFNRATTISREKETKVLKTDVELIKNCVIYKDQHFLALNKPPGLAVQGGSGQNNRNIDLLIECLREGFDEKPRLVHRLDKDTSGVLLVARTRKSAEELTKSFKQKRVRKIYWALVAGKPPSDIGTIKLSLLKKRLPNGNERMIIIAPDEETKNPEAKRATTDFVVIEKVAKRASWVGLSPITGRTHQLRAHMAAIGCPIIGDTKYGVRNQINLGDGWGAKIGGIISGKLHLHSRSIAFTHPITGNPIVIEAELPVHMENAWKTFNWQLKWAPRNPFEVYE